MCSRSERHRCSFTGCARQGKETLSHRQQRTRLAHIQLLMKELKVMYTAVMNCGIKRIHWPIKTENSAQLKPIQMYTWQYHTWMWEKSGVSLSLGCLQATGKWSSHKAGLNQQGTSWKFKWRGGERWMLVSCVIAGIKCLVGVEWHLSWVESLAMFSHR